MDGHVVSSWPWEQRASEQGARQGPGGRECRNQQCRGEGGAGAKMKRSTGPVPEKANAGCGSERGMWVMAHVREQVEVRIGGVAYRWR